jgi:oxaloacetate decarboxylase alpha subunit
VKKALEKNKYEAVLTERPADTIPNEFAKIEEEAKAVGAVSVEDALTFAMFPKVAPEFFKNRAKGPVDSASFVVKPAAPAAGGESAGKGGGQAGAYIVNVNGADYNVTVRPSGTLAIVPAGGTVPAGGAATPAPVQAASAPASPGGTVIPAPVAGTILRYAVDEGASVQKGDTVIIIESMKMELEIKTTVAGNVHFLVPTGAQVASSQPIAELK